MGASGADVSRDMYDETKRFQSIIEQQGKPWIAADSNDFYNIIFNLLRRFLQFYWSDGSPDDGFKIVGDSSDNDFSITGGSGTIESAGRLLIAGLHCFLVDDVDYADDTNFETTPVSTGLTENVLTDTAANFTLGGADDNLAGRKFVPDLTNPTFSYTIFSNTQTTLFVDGVPNMLTFGSLPKRPYRIELSTPSGGNRTDEVYVDCYLDEIDGSEDPDIKHTLGTLIETTRRIKLIQSVLVAEGATTPANYTDSDGNDHYTMKLATLERFDGQDAINVGDLTDTRLLSQPIIRDLSNMIHDHADGVGGGNTLLIPTIADFSNAVHTHQNPPQGGPLNHNSATDNPSSAHNSSGNLVGEDNAQVLTNKTLTTPTVANLSNMQHDHADPAGGGIPAINDFSNSQHNHTNAGNGGFATGLIRIVSNKLNNSFSNANFIPDDDTIPQISEGVQAIDINIAAKSTAHRLYIKASLYVSMSQIEAFTMALFVNSVSNALAAAQVGITATSTMFHLSLEFDYIPGTLDNQNLSIRVGAANPGTTFNINNILGTRRMGGVMFTSLSASEVNPLI